MENPIYEIHDKLVIQKDGVQGVREILAIDEIEGKWSYGLNDFFGDSQFAWESDQDNGETFVVRKHIVE